MNKELELISMVEEVMDEQRHYFDLKRKFGNATQQLDKCRALEDKLRKYCKARKSEILKPSLFEQQANQ